MEKKYLIYVACGSAAASASLARRRLIDALSARNIEAEIEVHRITELPGQIETRKPDAVVIAAGQAPSSIPEGVVVVKGVPLMTGFGIDKLVDDMLAFLKNKEG
jgi:galactitol-specific phosphotransferase system IIB component